MPSMIIWMRECSVIPFNGWERRSLKNPWYTGLVENASLVYLRFPKACPTTSPLMSTPATSSGLEYPAALLSAGGWMVGASEAPRTFSIRLMRRSSRVFRALPWANSLVRSFWQPFMTSAFLWARSVTLTLSFAIVRFISAMFALSLLARETSSLFIATLIPDKKELISDDVRIRCSFFTSARAHPSTRSL